MNAGCRAAGMSEEEPVVLLPSVIPVSGSLFSGAVDQLWNTEPPVKNLDRMSLFSHVT
jgi:hypothetical protein